MSRCPCGSTLLGTPRGQVEVQRGKPLARDMEWPAAQPALLTHPHPPTARGCHSWDSVPAAVVMVRAADCTSPWLAVAPVQGPGAGGVREKGRVEVATWDWFTLALVGVRQVHGAVYLREPLGPGHH